MSSFEFARALRLQSTASHVGKSVITAAFCRLFARTGYRVAPFKAQNMSNHSFVTRAGGEMGRAQAFQVQAAGIEPQVDMTVEAVRSAFARLHKQSDLSLIEGAGSPAEINRRDRDIVKMKVAALAEAPVLLVGDIERGFSRRVSRPPARAHGNHLAASARRRYPPQGH